MEPPENEQGQDYDEQYWRNFLTKGDTLERRLRGVFKAIPSDPRCQLCAAPFKGPGAPVMRLLGKQPARQNPRTCAQCFNFVSTHHGGAEIEATMLFADIRGSTALAESMSPTEFRALLDRFYTVATRVVFDHDGVLDKFVGDELVALFVPLFSGPDHAAKGIAAARALLERTGHGDVNGPWVPIGAGVNTAQTWYGTVGQGDRTELTAVGDAMNTTARLASAASAGEILVTTAAAAAAGLDVAGLERRSLELKGKQLTTDVVAVRVGAPAATERVA
ncbi:MAG TPA: adenylate/guanylate cyclase domain-containing protein [Candidatus Limnocylindrales bacterium]|nr:adenylate/guanylate cyclase domain-containing protein [Candidatus Limnocylindrales bacterium]